MAITHTFVCAIADDATAAANGEVVPTNWNADHAVTNLVLTHGTITTDVNTLGATVTWNAAGVTFTGIKLNVTDTASASGSLLADWQVGGVSKFQVTKDGRIGAARGYVPGTPQFYDSTLGSGHGFQIVNEYATTVCMSGAVQYQFDLSDETGFRFNAAWPISWMAGGAGSGTCYAQLRSDGAGVLAQRNYFSYTSAQTFRVYGTYTDSSNYVRASLAATSTTVTLAAETAGTGADNIDVTITPAGTGGVDIGAFYHQLSEMTAPAAPAANGCRIYAVDNGGGKTQLMALFSSGAAQQLAIQP